MRKNLIYSALVLLMGFVVYSCTKTDKDASAIEKQKEAIIQKTLNEINPLEPTNELLEVALEGADELSSPCAASLPTCAEPKKKVYYFSGTSNYPECEFWIIFYIVECDGVTHMVYDSYGNYPECEEFLNDIEKGGDNAGDILDAVKDELIYKAMIQNTIENGGLKFCEEDIAPIIKLYKASCYRYCGKRTNDSPFGYFLYSSYCGSGCCTSDVRICINTAKNVIEVEESNIQSSGVCTSTPFFQCKRGDDILSLCRVICDTPQE